MNSGFYFILFYYIFFLLFYLSYFFRYLELSTDYLQFPELCRIHYFNGNIQHLQFTSDEC